MSELKNCESCGRDTRRHEGICHRCIRGGQTAISDRKDRHERTAPEKFLVDMDDYSENSNPDTGAVWIRSEVYI